MADKQLNGVLDKLFLSQKKSKKQFYNMILVTYNFSKQTITIAYAHFPEDTATYKKAELRSFFQNNKAQGQDFTEGFYEVHSNGRLVEILPFNLTAIRYIDFPD